MAPDEGLETSIIHPSKPRTTIDEVQPYRTCIPPPSPSPSPANHTTKSRWHHFRFSKTQLALLILLAIQTIAVVTILSSIVASIQREIQMMNPQLKTISTYLVIFIVANVFSILMALDLLLNKNVVQLIALCIFNISMAIYGAVLPSQIKRSLQIPGGAVSWNGARYVSCYGVQYLFGDIQGRIVAIPVITGVCSVMMGYLTWLIYKEFGWEIFKQIGADLTLKRILQRKYFFYMLQKFVFFFFVGFSIQFLMLSQDVTTLEKVLTIAAVPFSLAVIVLGGVAVRNEIKWMMGAYVLVWLGAMIYFFYKLVRLYQNESISSAVKSLTIFSVLTILLLFAIGFMAGLCYLQFGKIAGGIENQTGLNESVWIKLIKSTGVGNCTRSHDTHQRGNPREKEEARNETSVIEIDANNLNIKPTSPVPKHSQRYYQNHRMSLD